ncbi:MAG: type II toxin-antitoxin system RelE/ParE family toxin [Coriobacteriia bacterium]|nr:type II toxin-antitoxin system RelE/ParE family toxin [Coriobacteriia bacterium]
MIEWQVALTGQAEADLRDIYEYIAFTLLEPKTATRLNNRFRTSISELRSLPKSHAAYQKEPWKSKGMRRMNVGNHAVFFVPFENKHAVIVLRVVYGGRDIDRILEDTPEA